MQKPSQSLNEFVSPLNGWPTSARQRKSSANAAQRSSRRPNTRGKRETGKNLGRPSGAKNRNRRDELLRRLKVDVKVLDSYPQIAPLLKECGINATRIIEVLRCDVDPLSHRAVELWDSLTPANRNLIGLEGLAVAAGLTPRRLWELYNGAKLMRSRESIGVMIADALPSIMRVTIKDAKKAKGFLSREHIYKAARVLPTPKGSVINIGVPGQKELEDGDDDLERGGMLEGADDFYLKASKAMTNKALPAPEIL